MNCVEIASPVTRRQTHFLVVEGNVKPPESLTKKTYYQRKKIMKKYEPLDRGGRVYGPKWFDH